MVARTCTCTYMPSNGAPHTLRVFSLRWMMSSITLESWHAAMVFTCSDCRVRVYVCVSICVCVRVCACAYEHECVIVHACVCGI